MKSRKKFLKKLFLAFLVLSIFSALYIHWGIFPWRIRPYVTEKMNNAFHKKFIFDKALYLPFHGMIFYNLRVAENDGSPLFQARRFSLDVKILPFLREKKIVTTVRLDSPVYDFILEPSRPVTGKKPVKTEISGQIEVPTVADDKKINLEDISEGPDAFLPENVYIEQIQISGGRVTIRKTQRSPAAETLNDINVRMAFQNPPNLYFDGSLKLGDTPYASVNLRGAWDLKKASYRFTLMTEWDKVPSWLESYQKNNLLVLHGGRVRLVTELQSVGEEKTFFHAKADLRNAQVTVREGRYSGHMQTDAKGLFNFGTKQIERYQGTLDLLDIDIRDLSPKIAQISHVRGSINFIPDLLTVRSLEGQYGEVSFTAKGEISSFEEPVVNGRIDTKVELQKILGLIPDEQKNLLKDFDIRGACEATTTVKGPLNSPSELSSEYKMTLHDATLSSHDGKIQITHLSSDLFSGKEGLKISRANFDFDKKNYSLNLFIPKNPLSSGTADLSTDGLEIKARYLLSGKKITVENAQASMPGIESRFTGRASLEDRPLLDIHGTASLDLAQVCGSLPPQAVELKNLKFSGDLDGDFSFKGTWNNLLNSESSFSGHSAGVSVRGLYLENLSVDAELKNGTLGIRRLVAQAYGGSFGLKGSVDISLYKVPFETDFYMNNVSLQQAATALNLENKKLSGSLSLQAALKGFLKNPESYTGQGSVSVKNGDLWETSQFKAMGILPLVRVEGLDWVVFHELSASCQIHDKKVWTDNLILQSDTVHLTLNGSIDFDQNLDMLMDIEYTNAVFLGAQDAGGLVPMMVNQASNFISQYKISGPLKKPNYDKVGTPVAGAVGKKIGGLLKNLTP